jgi:O-antigen/teichoic acid export membrane protein
MLISKSLFVFVAAKYLELSDLGLYSLVGVTISYGIYLLGLDFYTFTTRELIGLNEKGAAKYIIGQIRFCLLSYLFFFIPLLTLFQFEFLPWNVIGIFFVLLLSEFISQELTRILIAMEKTIIASCILFIRTAIWCYILAALFIRVDESRNIEWILYTWLFSSVLSVVIAMYLLRFVGWHNIFCKPLELKWIINGVKLAIPMLCSTLAIKTIFTIDKYSIEYLDGLSLLGVYAVYIGICNAFLSFMDAAVFQFKYPQLVKYKNINQPGLFILEVKRLSLSVIGYMAFILSTLFLVSELVFSYLNKPEYMEHIDIYWMLIWAHVILVLSYIPHYVLFAMKKDKWLLLAHFLALLTFICLIKTLNIESAIELIAIALLGSMSVTFITKLVVLGSFYKKNSVF